MNNVLSDFADAGITLLAQLNGIIEQLRTERDNLRKQIVEIDDKIVDIEKQHKVISDAVGITNYLPTPPEPGPGPTPERVTPRAAIKRTKRPSGVPQQKLWIATKLLQYGQIKVGTLADEMIEAYPIPKERAIQNISAELSRMLRVDHRITRTEPGVYKYTESEVNG